MSAWLCVNPVMLEPNGTARRRAVVASVVVADHHADAHGADERFRRSTIVGSIVVAALGCVFAIWLSARIYRVGMLMYGKKPSFRKSRSGSGMLDLSSRAP